MNRTRALQTEITSKKCLFNFLISNSQFQGRRFGFVLKPVLEIRFKDDFSFFRGYSEAIYVLICNLHDVESQIFG